jgi:hypothetical protein
MAIVMKLTWTWGGSKIVSAQSTDILSDVLCSNGFVAVSGTELYVAHRGRFLDISFSVGFHELKPGDRLICHVQKLPSKDQSRRFLESLTPSRRFVSHMSPVTDLYEANRRTVNARLDDLSFASWESLPDYRGMMADLLQEQEEQNSTDQSDDDLYQLNFTEATEISDQPLPSMFHADGLGHGSSGKGGGWTSAYVKDIADQSRRGSFFDHLKK